ncbi:CHASE3 domain-containing protein [Sphingomonas oligophenolica]|uniref:histidine kinase n=1 Tax=Sphingomonas oligophenolica TaxID=301154 RepID=A0ABU9Y2Z5_9SPHN
MLERLFTRIGGTSRSVSRWLVGLMVIGFASLVLTGLSAAWLSARTQDHTSWINHTYEVELAISQANTLVEQAETTRRGYILSDQPTYLDIYRRTTAKLPAALQRIGDLTRDNPTQQANLRKMRALIDGLQAQRDRTNALVTAGQLDQARRAFITDTDARQMPAIRALTDEMRRVEERLLAIRDADQQASVQAFYLVLAIAGIILLLVAVASLVTILRYTRDLAASRDTLRDFADSLEELVKERTADLSRANEEIQRFAYIVSHDLRSPLVNVMGFTAELEAATTTIADLIERAEQACPDIVTQEARLAAREDLPEAIGFIRTSTQKMDRLINAILKLSREGRRLIAPEAIDMDALVSAIGETLQHAIKDRGARLVIESPLPDIVSDRLAIEQIFSNLIENAVKYLQPGRPGLVAVRGSRDGARVTYEIEDNGRGIDPRDHQRVFDLFRRSGNQDQPGEGIGLAHVRALAYRLGGIVDVQSDLGKGATFRLSLPARLADAPTR